MTYILANKIFNGLQWLKETIIHYENGEIIAFCQPEDVPKNANIKDYKNAIITPNFIDIQVNGGGGILLNDTPTAKAIKTVGEAHKIYGTGGYLPTFITDTPSLLPKALEAAKKAHEDKNNISLGIHLEGPWISPEKAGVHKKDYIRPLNNTEMQLICDYKSGAIMVTIAPEIVSPAQIKELTKEGVIVFLGHSMADYKTTIKAIDAGATGVTHLFNAMSQLESRNPNMVGAALLDNRLKCGLIADGIHIHPANLNMVYQAKSAKNIALVTDAMPLIGDDALPQENGDIPKFNLYGDDISIKDGACRNKNGRLAGSALTMIGAVKYLANNTNIPLADILQSASQTPSQILKLTKPNTPLLSPNSPTNFLLLNENLDIIFDITQKNSY